MYSGLLVLVLMSGQQVAGRNVDMDFAETSWPSVITEDGAVILTGQIREVEGPRPEGLNQQAGTATIHVNRELTPSRWKGGPEIKVAFRQLASFRSRQREGNGGWNGVDVKPGAMLMMGLAGQNGPAKGPVSLQAVTQVASGEDHQVTAVVQALQIEATTAPQDRLRLLHQALNTDLPILESYAHFALGRKKRVPREDGARLEIAALLDRHRPAEKRRASESNLELELWADTDPSDTVNRSIVRALLQVLAAREPDLLRSTTIALHRIFFARPAADPEAARLYRSSLLEDSQAVDMKAVRTALGDAQKDPNTASQAQQLIELFSPASR